MSFRLFGVSVHIDFRLLSMLTLFALFDKNGGLKYSLASMALHECGHLAALFLTGGRPERLEFLPGGMVIHTGRPLGFPVVIGGIAANVLSAAIMLPLRGWLFRLGAVNLLFGLVSLIPTRPLDGAALLELLLDGTWFGDRLCRAVSAAAGVMLCCGGVYLLLMTSRNFSLFILSVWLIYDILENSFVKRKIINECIKTP